MFSNYLKIALRSLRKNSVYSFINIAGLAIGLACSILILLWVNDELNWNKFHARRDRIFEVMLNGQGDTEMYTQMAVSLPIVDGLKETERDIKYAAATNWGDTYLLSVGDKKLYKKGYYAGQDFLKIFTFPLISGNADKQLSDPGTIVITESTAKAFFGDVNALGKIIRVDDDVDLTVSGVVKDVPSNSTFQFECLIPFTTYMNREPWVKNSLTNWGNNSFNIYVEIAEHADIDAIEQRVKGMVKKHEEGTTQEVTFHNIDRWKLYADFKNGKSVGGDIEFVRMFSIIALFILVIACINFMNLATARSERRAREVGIRKSVGSNRKELIAQFLGETFFIALLSGILAVGIVEAVLPFSNNIVHKELHIDYGNPVFWLVSLGVIVVTSLMAGSYPAFYLSSFRPAQVLKGKMQLGNRGSSPRKIMVTVQFLFSMMLIISTIAIYSQIEHLKDRPVGYDRNNLMLISATGDINKNYKIIKQQLADQGLAANVTESSSPVTNIYAFTNAEWTGKREQQRKSIATVATGLDYTRTMGIRVLEGRDFSEEFNDSTSMLINQAAVEYMEFKKPIGEKIHWNDRDYTVIGVMENVIMQSAARDVAPMMLVYDPGWFGTVSIRLPADRNPHEVIPKIEHVFKENNPAYPFIYRFTDDEFSQKFSGVELIGRLANLFAGLAIVISCLGLFGLAAFTAEQRTKEIGIRKVLGATITNVVLLLSRDFTTLILIAFLIAAPLSWWGMESWLARYTYRINMQWWIVGLAGGLTLVLSLVTVSFQALKAAMSNPVDSLRSE